MHKWIDALWVLCNICKICFARRQKLLCSLVFCAAKSKPEAPLWGEGNCLHSNRRVFAICNCAGVSTVCGSVHIETLSLPLSVCRMQHFALPYLLWKAGADWGWQKKPPPLFPENLWFPVRVKWSPCRETSRTFQCSTVITLFILQPSKRVCVLELSYYVVLCIVYLATFFLFWSTK